MMENVLLVILVIGAAIFAIRRGIPGLITRQGYSHQDRGEYDAAEQSFLKALSFEKAMEKITGQRIGVALQYSNIGFVYHHQKRLKDAASMFRRAIDIYANLGRLDDSAPIYASLGKIYFDSGDFHLAEESLNKAFTIYSRRSGSQEAINTIKVLLEKISISRREENPAVPRDYRNTQYAFSFKIPAGWERLQRVGQFQRTGGQVAITHKTLNATFNVSVGPPDRPEWRTKEIRASAVRDFLTREPGRIRGIEVTTSTLVGGEANTVSAEYETHDAVRGVPAKFKNSLISIVHSGLEYAIQWRATPEYEDSVRTIITSFQFEK